MSDETTSPQASLTAKDVTRGMYVRLSEEKLSKLDNVRGTPQDSWHVDEIRELDGDVIITLSSKELGSHILPFRPDEEIFTGETPSE